MLVGYEPLRWCGIWSSRRRQCFWAQHHVLQRPSLPLPRPTQPENVQCTYVSDYFKESYLAFYVPSRLNVFDQQKYSRSTTINNMKKKKFFFILCLAIGDV